MRVRLVAVGRLKDGPERQLALRYRERAAGLGRGLGLSGPDVTELPEARARSTGERVADEAERIGREIQGASVVCLDERAPSPTSRAFADRLAAWRDAGVYEMALVIGGPDGLGPDLRAAAAWSISFGAMTLPHGLVRVLALEQLYRAFTIMAGHPYHRAGIA